MTRISHPAYVTYGFTLFWFNDGFITAFQDDNLPDRILRTSLCKENHSGGLVDGSHFLWSQCLLAIGSGHPQHTGCRFIFSLLLTQIKCRFIKLWNILSSQGFNKGLPNLKNLLWFKLLSDVLLIILNESLGWLWCLWANIEISWKYSLLL